jgi:hypothetical protein
MGITDGSVYCGWCGEDRTSCNLCGGLAPLVGLVGPGVSEENKLRSRALTKLGTILYNEEEPMKWLGDKGYQGE